MFFIKSISLTEPRLKYNTFNAVVQSDDQIYLDENGSPWNIKNEKLTKINMNYCIQSVSFVSPIISNEKGNINVKDFVIDCEGVPDEGTTITQDVIMN